MDGMPLEISLENCQYRGEGNSCLVVRLRSFKGEPKVIRLIKETYSENCADAQVTKKRLEDNIVFVKNVIQPLLGEDFVHCPFVISVSAEEVKAVNEIVKNFRPSHRRNKIVKEAKTYAVVLPDYCSLPKSLWSYPTVGPVISVEIKPKHGFLISNGFLFSGYHKPLLCWFCMMQYYKLQRNVVSERSCYCPLELFSGCPKRMQNAVKSLYQTPQNNLRIFKDGELAFSEEKRCSVACVLEDFITQDIDKAAVLSELIVDSLLKPSRSICCDFSWKSNSLEHVKCNNSSEFSSSGAGCGHELPEDCVLYRILKLQMLDTVSNEQLYSFYLEMKKRQNESEQMIGILPRQELPPHMGEEKQLLSESDMQFVSRKVWEFLLALTLKDCSLMFTFKRLDAGYRPSLNLNDQHIVADKNGNSYLYSVAVIDLDMKPLSKVEENYKKRIEIVESYLQTKQCT